ncbi:hypothetical protein T4E_5631 [Trichinella pseudospiralis]|uniref:Uncharacterized protein n=1 Tax=Trichinella pseudospiralis TaxID=6337 RepID=A0A0V0XT83_TRIPS|nr:hypothetical protein T4E_5631 [Trichinella pseudospiralis]
MPYNPTQLSESCTEYHGLSSDLHDEGGYSAFPDISGLVDQSESSVWNCRADAAVDQPPAAVLEPDDSPEVSGNDLPNHMDFVSAALCLSVKAFAARMQSTDQKNIRSTSPVYPHFFNLYALPLYTRDIPLQ